jgi:hypothetical protein
VLLEAASQQLQPGVWASFLCFPYSLSVLCLPRAPFKAPRPLVVCIHNGATLPPRPPPPRPDLTLPPHPTPPHPFCPCSTWSCP